MDDMPTWAQTWTIWINAYRAARPASQPIGWYTSDDMRAAFDAGARADQVILDRIRQAASEAAQEEQ